VIKSDRLLGIFEKETTIELGDLTIICGNNNTGKTYASYAIFGFLDTWNQNISFDIPENKLQKLYRDGSIQLDLNDFAQTRIIGVRVKLIWYNLIKNKS
jgi:predicted ATPase